MSVRATASSVKDCNRLQLANCARDLALFDLAIDSKLRACDLVRLRVRDVSHGDRVAARTIVMQQKTQRPVQFEITEQTREAVARWIDHAKLQSEDFLSPSRLHNSAHLSTRQYARIVDGWVQEIGLDPAAYGTHTLRRTKASLIYRDAAEQVGGFYFQFRLCSEGAPRSSPGLGLITGIGGAHPEAIALRRVRQRQAVPLAPGSARGSSRR